jgi:hypothetical protein
MLKPDYLHFDIQTPELRHYIDIVITIIPLDYWVRLATRELFIDLEDAFIYMRNWGFTQGILLIKESTNNRKGRWKIDCSHHYKETSNWRKTSVEDRQRLDTHSHSVALNELSLLYISSPLHHKIT